MAGHATLDTAAVQRDDFAPDPIKRTADTTGVCRHLSALVAMHVVAGNEARVAREIAAQILFSFNEDRSAATEGLMPLAAALDRAEISERPLA